MKTLALAGALALAFAASGCAQLNAARDWLAEPSTQQAAATLRTAATALACDVSSGSQLALEVEKQIANTAGAQATTGIVYTTSTAICGKLSGRVVGQASNVVAVSAVAQ